MKPDPVAPILILWDSQTPNRFSCYITEILQIEGCNWFTVHDLSRETVTEEQLAAYPVAILTHVDPSAEVQEQVLAYLRGGWNLIALRPPESLADAFGLRPRGQEMVDRYLRLSRGCALNAGVEPHTLQFHGRAEVYEWHVDGAQVMAHLGPFSDVVTRHPAVAVGVLGKGRWTVFAYDLSESTVLFHQGRKDQASTGPHAEPTGDRSFKPHNLFVGYLDPELCHLPQADIHQDALVRVLEWMTSSDRPLPRIWYFPDGGRAVAFINGDGDGMTRADLENVVATAERYGAAYTAYLMMQDHDQVPPEWEVELRARGHDTGQHAFAGQMPILEEMRSRLREEMGAFRARYGHESLSYRGHCVIWVGWTEMAEYLSENGVRLDTNFAAGRYCHGGYLNGSGLPVKFMDEAGRVMDIYEQVTMSTDGGWTLDKMFVPALSVDECIERSRQQIDASVDRCHTVYHPYFHPIRTRPGPVSTQPWLEAVLGHCRDRGLPCVSGADWVRFNDGRRGLGLSEYAFDPEAGVLEISLEADAAVRGAAVCLPHVVRGRALARAQVDGESVAVAAENLEGRMQMLLPADYAEGEIRRWRIQWGDDPE